MVLLVASQRTGIAIALVTTFHVALIGLLITMGQHVAVQMILALEGLVAQVADVLALIGVGQLVFRQCAGVGEHLPTDGAGLR